MDWPEMAANPFPLAPPSFEISLAPRCTAYLRPRPTSPTCKSFTAPVRFRVEAPLPAGPLPAIAVRQLAVEASGRAARLVRRSGVVSSGQRHLRYAYGQGQENHAAIRGDGLQQGG